MKDTVIRVEGIGKRYHIGLAAPRYQTIRDTLTRVLTAPFHWLRRGSPKREEARTFWALKNVSFEVKRGEVVGIIGRNGAGKSTLLKILSRITEPTTGQADLCGRVGSLLEVGTGFHTELTGRENIFLNGAILGMRRAEIVRKFDEIVTFAEVEQFLDTPVKHYSSGMHMRLAFAVAAHLEPEILVVDEVLAVGDAPFQSKCLGKMSEVARQGRTVLFVSHNMHAVQSLCNRGLVLHQGQIQFEGTAGQSVTQYLTTVQSAGRSESNPETRPGTGEWRFTRVTAATALFDSSEPKEFAFQVAPLHLGAGPAYLSGLLLNEQGTVLTQFDSRLVGFSVSGATPLSGRLRIDGVWLKPGRYTLDLYICSPGGILDLFERAAEFDVSPVLPYPQSSSADATASALVLANFTWRLDS